MRKYTVKSEDCEKICSILATCKKIYVKNRVKIRRFLGALTYMAKEGCSWRALPKWYGHWRTVHKRYKEWCEKKIFDLLLSHISKDYDGEYIMIDSTIVKAHPCSSGSLYNNNEAAGLGRSRGGFTTKIHVVVDALGMLLDCVITPGHHSDIKYAQPLLEKFENAYVIADRAYDCDQLLSLLKNNNCTAVIPGKCNRKQPRKHDKHIYKERHAVENFFLKIKNYRRVFSRFDKEIYTFKGFVVFVSILLWLK